jgi:hypothetical protein
LANTLGTAATKYIEGTWTSIPNFTVSFWFNCQSHPVSGSSCIVGFAGANFSMYINLNAGTLAMQFLASDGGYYTINAPSAITTNVWYHVVAVYQQSGTCSLYVNGTSVGTMVGRAFQNPPNRFRIGDYAHGSGSPYNGYISNFKIYNTAGFYDNWSPMPRIASSPLLPLSIACDSTGQVLSVAAGTDGVYQSTNGGSTWALKDSIVVPQIEIQPNKVALAANTWVQDGISWTSSASTAISGNDPFVPFNDGTIVNSWNTTSFTYTPSGNSSGIYSTFYTNGSSTQTVQGDWLQIRSSNPLVMKSYQLGCGNSNNLPSRFYVIGSNNGITWYALQYANAVGRPTNGVYEVIPGTIVVNSTSSQSWGATTLSTTSYDGSAAAYTYFRLIVTNSYYGPETVAQIGRWAINAIPYAATIQPQLAGISSNAWSSKGVNWTSTASSVNGSWSVYKAFNTTIGDAWLSSNSPSPYYDNGTPNLGVAGSTTVLGGIGVLRGEWLQMQSSTPKVLKSFSLGLGPNPWPYTNAPANYYIIGSTDGTSWYPIQSGTFSISNFTAAGTDITINYTGTQTLGGGMPGSVATTAYSSSTRAYTYFRLIGTSIMSYGGGGSTYMELGEWFMNFLDDVASGSLIPYIHLPLENSVADITGNSTITSYGTIQYLSGPAGNYAVNLQNTPAGVANNYLRGTWAGSDHFTISFQFNYQSNTPSNLQEIFSAYGGALVLYISSNNNTLGWSIPSGGTGVDAAVTPYPLVIGVWYSVICTFQKNGLCCLYVNGDRIGCYTNVGGTGIFSTTTFTLGALDNPWPGYAFNGYISDFRIYGYALPPPTGGSMTKIASDATGANLLTGDTANGYVYRSTDSGASWNNPVIVDTYPGSYAGAMQSLSIDPTGVYAFASYYDISSVMSQRSSGLPSTAWTTTNGQYYAITTFSTNNQYQTAINVVDRFTSTGHTTISYSTDSGATWTNGIDLGGSVSSIAADATGQYVVAVVETNGAGVPAVYRSIDYGASFSVLLNSPDYSSIGSNCIACSSTGQHLYVGSYNGDIYVSSNSGNAWTSTASFPNYVSVITCNYSGQYVYALTSSNIYISTNYGQSWNNGMSISSYGCSHIACDWSGQNVVASCNGDGIYRSTNYGQTWTKTSAPSNPLVGGGSYYYRIACNSTGQRIVAMDLYNSTLYLSTDAGTTWVLQYTPESMTSEAFMGVSMSADGTRSVAGFYAPGTYFLDQGTPDLQPVSVPCFLEGTKILCHVNGEDQYIPIETMRPGTIVKTSRDGYKAVKLIGSRLMQNPGTGVRDKNALYLCTKEQYPDITEDLTITGCHAILVDTITEVEREGIIATLERIFITDKKYRLPACVDQKAKEVLVPGPNVVWHFALEHYHDRMNYGVYAQGLLVETSPIWHMNTKNYNLVD